MSDPSRPSESKSPGASDSSSTASNAIREDRPMSVGAWATKESKAKVDFTNFKDLAKTYFSREEGRDLRTAHRGFARQYQKMYGYSVGVFVLAAGLAYGLASMNKTSSKKED